MSAPEPERSMADYVERIRDEMEVWRDTLAPGDVVRDVLRLARQALAAGERSAPESPDVGTLSDGELLAQYVRQVEALKPLRGEISRRVLSGQHPRLAGAYGRTILDRGI